MSKSVVTNESDNVRPVGSSAYDAVKRDIIRCRLQPGAVVTEMQLTERYRVSRGTIRTVLNRLGQEELVQVAPRAGYLVTPITFKHVRDLFGVRSLLEPAATRMAAGRVDGDELQTMQRLCEVAYVQGDDESIDSHLRANTSFHLTIVRAAGNDQLTSILGVVLDRMERVLHFTYLIQDHNASIGRNHHELIELLVAGRGEEAERVSQAGIERSQSSVLAALTESPSLERVSLAAL